MASIHIVLQLLPASRYAYWAMQPKDFSLAWGWPISFLCLLIWCLFKPQFRAHAQTQAEYELPPINYSATAPSNRLTALEQKLESGKIQTSPTNDRHLLQKLLDELEIPVESQVLVFSKTSLQRKLINPKRPRAIYFSDDAYLGWVPGGLFEATVTDPHLGLAFYACELPSNGEQLRFTRDEQCLSCHAGSLTRNWPGLMIRSIYPDSRGEPIASGGSFLTGHESPLSERWGGWYVTGRHGTETHMGNVSARENATGAELDRQTGANRTNLQSLVATDDYLLPDSDIVALMVLEHQVNMHTRLAQGALRARKWIHYQQQLRQELGEPATAELTGTAKRVVAAEAERTIEYLLFSQEIPLPKGGIQGAGRFEPAFQRNRYPDPQGRSLKDFDLRTRLFRYRCSYMIYSEAFNSLPPELKTQIYQRLHEILTAPQPPKNFTHLEAAERTAIRQILTATKPVLAAAWQTLKP